ncbi:ExeA family protein [Desulfobacula sp.]|uniref:ExeA family protein n=1 Tax=Desulfobacula sp. TaxID=2593537 RepID=UPI00262BDD65|nr:ExeA family protein [Desulfobacula sp.]
MYNAFFDFREKPFKLVPNPEFLFLGKSHEEALAHLTYATSQGDGFVEITGEVGTGKTTLCRVFLEALDKEIEAAFIFNSKLNAVQLLKAIHRELGIDCPADDPADLTLALNRFLLEKKAQGKSVILLIDEAQNLGRETLEQLRLLSNLETTRSKLLQIILVGQPELGEILDSYEMRQLRQRINLSCHIMPMRLAETRKYIEHRINVASRKPRALFTHAAQKDIYTYSRGIPRLVNIACDRSLLAAYSLNLKKVTPSTVRIAVSELAPGKYRQAGPISVREKISWTLFTLLFTVILFLAVYNGIPPGWIPDIKAGIPPDTLSSQPIVTPKAPPKPLPLVDVAQLPPVAPEPVPLEPALFPVPPTGETADKQIVSRIHTAATREDVISHVLSLWRTPSVDRLNPLIQQITPDPVFFITAAAQHHLQLLHLERAPDLIEKYNLPAILGVASVADTINGYVAVVKITADNHYILFTGKDNDRVSIPPDLLGPFLTGDVYIPWKDDFGYADVISETAPKASIVLLKLFLRQIGFLDVDTTDVYDGPVRAAVKQCQARYGLTVDGLVGPLTKIMLSSEARQSNVPYLDKSRFKNDPLKGK